MLEINEEKEELKTWELSDEELNNVAGGARPDYSSRTAYLPDHMCNLWESKYENESRRVGCYDCKFAYRHRSRCYFCEHPDNQ